MIEDTIKRSDAIKALTKFFSDDDMMRGEMPNCRHNKWRASVLLERVPSVDRPQEWIPCSERLPRPYTEVLVCDECGWISLGLYRPCDVTEKDSGWSTLTRIKIPTDGIIAWMPLPEPWKGADDE